MAMEIFRFILSMFSPLWSVGYVAWVGVKPGFRWSALHEAGYAPPPLQPCIIGNSLLDLGITWGKKFLSIAYRMSWPHRKISWGRLVAPNAFGGKVTGGYIRAAAGASRKAMRRSWPVFRPHPILPPRRGRGGPVRPITLVPTIKAQEVLRVGGNHPHPDLPPQGGRDWGPAGGAGRVTGRARRCAPTRPGFRRCGCSRPSPGCAAPCGPGRTSRCRSRSRAGS